MRIDLRDTNRNKLFTVTVDPAAPASVVRDPADSGRTAMLSWDKALDAELRLVSCPACGCRELFARKDFPQRLGLLLVVVFAVASVVLYAMGRVVASMGVLGAVAVANLLVAPLLGRCLVCYRCRSEFRSLPIDRRHPGWDLETGEKYRIVHAER